MAEKIPVKNFQELEVGIEYKTFGWKTCHWKVKNKNKNARKQA